MSAELPYLPDDPRERETFLRALREYSDNCGASEISGEWVRDGAVEGLHESGLTHNDPMEAPVERTLRVYAS